VIDAATHFVVMPGLVPGIHVLDTEDVDGRDKPGMTKHLSLRGNEQNELAADYSAKTASILVCSVWALNGLTM
jgi:hypothetical protein